MEVNFLNLNPFMPFRPRVFKFDILSIGLSPLKCISTSGPSSSVYNHFSMLFIPSAFFGFDLPLPILCSKIILPLLHPFVGVTSPILPLLVEFSFVALESPVLSVFFGLVSVPFSSSFFRRYFLISLFELFF